MNPTRNPLAQFEHMNTGLSLPGGDTLLSHLHKHMSRATKTLDTFGALRGMFSPNVQQKLRKEAGTLKHYGSSFLATCGNGHTDTDVLKNKELQGFPGGPVIKNSHSNTGDLSSIPGWGTKIPHAGGPPSPCTTITEAHVPH